MSFKFINGIQPNPIKDDFDGAMDTLLENIHKNYVNWCNGDPIREEEISLKPGRKFIKVIRGNSVYAVVSNKMEKEDATRMKEKLDQILSRDTDLSIEVDESLIGGMKLRIENTYLDASIKSQINNIKLDLMKT